MQVYVCQRWLEHAEDWKGALLIAAHSEQEAIEVYVYAEWHREPPKSIYILAGVTAIGEPRVLYDDEVS